MTNLGIFCSWVLRLIVFVFSDNIFAENSKLFAESGNRGNQLLECMLYGFGEVLSHFEGGWGALLLSTFKSILGQIGQFESNKGSDVGTCFSDET